MWNYNDWSNIVSRTFVIFTDGLRVEQAIRVPQPVVNELYAWRDHIAGRVITVTKKLLDHPEVSSIDLSDELAKRRPPATHAAFFCTAPGLLGKGMTRAPAPAASLASSASPAHSACNGAAMVPYDPPGDMPAG